jgi:hypothetical protein
MNPKLLDKIVSSSLKQTTLRVDEWDVELGVREMTAEQRVAFAERAKSNPRVATVRLVIDCTYDPENNLAVFEPAHQDMLLSKSGAAVERIAGKIVELSGLTESSVKELEKN